jgi:hypothetical protein
MSTVNVVLDTEVFVSFRLDFSHASLRRLSSLPILNNYQLIISDITDKEIKSKIKDMLKVSQAIVIQLNKIPSWQRRALQVETPELDFEDVADVAIREYEQFKGDVGIQVISSDTVKVSDYIDLYFDELPPFSAKKKSEFPDAISLISLEKYLGSSPKYIISRDGDWNRFYKGKSNTVVFESLSKFFENELSKQSNNINELKEQLYKRHNEKLVLNLFKNELSKGGAFDAYIQSRAFNFHSEEMRNLRIAEINIISIEKYDIGKYHTDLKCTLHYIIEFDVEIEVERVTQLINGASIDIPVRENVTFSSRVEGDASIKDNVIQGIYIKHIDPIDWKF